MKNNSKNINCSKEQLLYKEIEATIKSFADILQSGNFALQEITETSSFTGLMSRIKELPQEWQKELKIGLFKKFAIRMNRIEYKEMTR